MMKRAALSLTTGFLLFLHPMFSDAQTVGPSRSSSGSSPSSAAPQGTAGTQAPEKSVEDDVATLKKQVASIQEALKQEKEDPDFSLVLGVGSLVVGPASRIIRLSPTWSARLIWAELHPSS
jgi:hypothetical protein